MSEYEALVICQSGKTVRLPMTPERYPDHLRLTLPRAVVPADFKEIRLLPERFRAHAGDDGYYVAPLLDAASRLVRFRARPDVSECRMTAAFMPICGKKSGGIAELMVLDGMALDINFFCAVQNGVYDYYPVIDRGEPKYWTDSDLYEDISLDLFTLTGADADYNGMARCYRAFQLARGRCRPLAEKAKERPLLDELARGPEIRIRMAWKPAPSPVPEQTHCNEPPMHVACTFAQVETLIDALKRQGVAHAEICLVGWNVRGHDGRYPEIFPVEPALGGETALRHLILYAQQAGYRIVGHTNSTDCYSVADGWTPDWTMKNPDGTPQKNAFWSGGQMYNLAACYAEQFAARDLPQVRALGFCGAHYIDVISTVSPRRDYDPNHPCTRRQCAQAWNRILAQGTAQFGGIASESGYDFAAGVLDFGLYTYFGLGQPQSALGDEIIPLHPLVYHGIMLYNPGTVTVNYPIKDAQSQLRFYEYGGRPAIYFYSRFMTTTNWMGDADFHMDTPDDTQHSAEKIAAMLREYAPFASLQYVFMERHERVGEQVSCVTYSDGTRLAFNFAADPATVDGQRVPAQSWALLHAGGAWGK